MNAEPIYVVLGWTGEYSEREDWVVAAFRSEKDAKTQVQAAEEKAREILEAREQDPDCEPPENPYDPEMQMDYTGTFYYYQATQLYYEPTNPSQKEPSDAT